MPFAKNSKSDVLAKFKSEEKKYVLCACWPSFLIILLYPGYSWEWMANLNIENIKYHFWKNHKRHNKLLNQYINSQGKQEKDFTKRPTFTLFDRNEIQQITEQIHQNNNENSVHWKANFNSQKSVAILLQHTTG